MNARTRSGVLRFTVCSTLSRALRIYCGGGYARKSMASGGFISRRAMQKKHMFAYFGTCDGAGTVDDSARVVIFTCVCEICPEALQKSTV